MSDDKKPETQNVAIRVVEWAEWLPAFPDEATDGHMALTQGVSSFQILKGERVLDVEVMATGKQISRKIRDSESEEEGHQTFGLYMFQAVVASNVEGEIPPPLVVAKPPEDSRIKTPGPDLVLPGGMKQKTGRHRNAR